MREEGEKDLKAGAPVKVGGGADATSRTPPPARWEVFAILFFVGAAIMAVEILGTRVIGPVFGVNLWRGRLRFD